VRGHQNPQDGREESCSAQFALFHRCGSHVRKKPIWITLCSAWLSVSQSATVCGSAATLGWPIAGCERPSHICGGNGTVRGRASRQFLAAPTAATRRPRPEVVADRRQTVPRVGRNSRACTPASCPENPQERSRGLVNPHEVTLPDG
jgi:hypothetical protein